MVRTSDCGSDNRGSNPRHGIPFLQFLATVQFMRCVINIVRLELGIILFREFNVTVFPKMNTQNRVIDKGQKINVKGQKNKNLEINVFWVAELKYDIKNC